MIAPRHLRMVGIWAVFLALPGAAHAGDTIKLALTPAFEGSIHYGRSCPVVVEIKNDGPEIPGTLSTMTQDGTTDYPVDLPAHATRRVMTYPKLEQQPLVRVVLKVGDKLIYQACAVPMAAPEPSCAVLVIGGEADSLNTFLPENAPPDRPGRADSGYPIADSYTSPELAPSRPAGYSAVDEIVLLDGADRLGDEQIEAIRLWVITGGRLVFIGREAAPILADRRWADLLPARDFHMVRLGPEVPNAAFFGSPGESLADYGQAETPAVDVVSATPLEGTTGMQESDALLSAAKSYGEGEVAYLSFNPFEAPLKTWAGRRKALTTALEPSLTLLLNAANVASAGDQPAGLGAAAEDDPFGMQLPPAMRVFWILAAYFVVVVPVNFLVLKKFRRVELAWFTAPVISLVFAGVLFASAGNLYRAKMSIVTNGMIAGQDGSPQGIFVGTTEMFIPHAGTYDLGLKDVDSLGPTAAKTNDSMFPGGQSGMAELGQGEQIDATDAREIQVPELQVNNLSFDRLTYRQRVPIGDWLHVRLVKTSPTSARCVCSNTGPYRLVDAVLECHLNQIDLGVLEPGQTTIRDITIHQQPNSTPKAPKSHRAGSPEEAEALAAQRTSNRVALKGALDGFQPGPHIGQWLTARSKVTVEVFSSWQGADR